ncbi:PLP-dependent aminotransferase family protein [Fusibacter paucivorans]|uniref:PLP-dependent aminotransferase family protein n=1 Tax=Fusibacter paucivorans TaxID=76009 RepID=A0ABS5PNX9_9FIRM|nr:PLP-dependent aminotransferase family protein [Fusibacter paucivorans]MBS7526632.1 PLP-dependent aminotransferase family protein [Fusibacter paucivorans]
MWGITVNRDDEMTLSRQIFTAFRDQILAGELEQGEILPSTRALSIDLGVSRNTVSEAYEMLWTEGFIVTQQGAQSRVADGLVITRNVPEAVQKPIAMKQVPIEWHFKTGQPDLSLFPKTQWRKMIREAVDDFSTPDLTYSGPKGYEPLCEAISKWLMRSRNMHVPIEDIFITAGATQAFFLLVEILKREGCAFALENPSHPAMRTAVTDSGSMIQWMTVTQSGIETTALKKVPIAAVYTTPSHQFPLGGILQASTRAELIRLAAECDFYIIEDDYDSEYRYFGAPISPIYAMDASRVIYVGTFSKTLFPALRIGFAVIPKSLQTKWRHFRNYLDVQNPILEQMALAKFLNTRKMDKHIQHMRRIYAAKRQILLEAIEEQFDCQVLPWGDASGLHLALQFPGHAFNDHFIERCRMRGLFVQTVQQYCTSELQHQDKLLLGYGHLRETTIKEGIAVLKEMIQQMPS